MNVNNFSKVLQIQRLRRSLDADIAKLFEEEERPKKFTRRVVRRDHADGHRRIVQHYFSGSDNVYDKKTFRRRFRMQRSLFVKILNAVQSHDNYFVQKADCTGKPGLSALQKVVAAIRQLAYGLPADAIDEYVQIGETTALECLIKFCEAVIEIYGKEYLREPNEEDLLRLLKQNGARGFPGMLGSLDCMHWEWKNCPTSMHGQYRGKEKAPTLVLEAVASYDLWIWHAFFGLPGSLNDINVLDRSHHFDSVGEGRRPEVNFTVSGNTYHMGYYLVDGIYPKYSTLMPAIKDPQNDMHKVNEVSQTSTQFALKTHICY